MTAKEMFAAIGYKYYDHKMIEFIPPNYFVPQDEPYLEYIEKSDKGEEHIKFHGHSEIVSVEAIAYIGDEKLRIPAPLNAAEITAIMKQFEELGWLQK